MPAGTQALSCNRARTSLPHAGTSTADADDDAPRTGRQKQVKPCPNPVRRIVWFVVLSSGILVFGESPGFFKCFPSSLYIFFLHRCL
jgi:hypothetical protein